MDYIHKDRYLLDITPDEVKDYLLSDQLFWPLNSGERLTIGNLLLALIRSKSFIQTSDEIQRNNQFRENIFLIRSQWRTNWSNKCTLEFHSRLRQWELALREILTHDKKNTVIYAHEVTLRVILSLLQSEMLQTEMTFFEHLAALDKLLHAASQKTDFIWDTVLEAQFPEDKFWFLYCNPTTGE